LRIEPGAGTNIVVEGAPGPLAEEARRTIAELAGAAVEWRPIESGSGRDLRIAARGEVDDAVERGLLRAILRLEKDFGWSGWLGKVWSRR